MLESLRSPGDIKKLNNKEIDALCAEIRSNIMTAVASNGGHLSSNLGMVETTVALHRVFDLPDDKLVFDVGHQCYAHKLLTGRYESFGTLRRHGGISGFANRFESEYDTLTEGHCGTSISAAIGIAEANKLENKDSMTVAVLGDGALTNGLVYEALNNCADKKLNLVILINDNEMFISPNVGGLHKYLSSLRTSKRYFSFKHDIEKILLHIPLVGKALAGFVKRMKDYIKRCFMRSTLFEDMGLLYLGPIDGHDIGKLSEVLKEAKTKNRPCIVHVCTKKGLGYPFAEADPERYHSIGPFDLSKGFIPDNKTTFSSVACDILCKRAESDARICAITAAMCGGTGLTGFREKFPERFFDVGIAEEHAVTFAGGLAVSGMRPAVFMYSTFAQRAFDQLFHDISIQRLPLILVLDRGGLVAGDGITHQGIFDYALFSSLPGTVIYSPGSYEDLNTAFSEAFCSDGLTVIRYPKGAEDVSYKNEAHTVRGDCFDFSPGTEGADAVIVTYGRTEKYAYEARELLGGRVKTGVIGLNKIMPLCSDEIIGLVGNAGLVYIPEEGIRYGGMGEKLAASLSERGYRGKVFIKAVERYAEHGSTDELMRDFGLTGEQIARDILEITGLACDDKK